jgi:predicted Zn-dependent peptidase
VIIDERPLSATVSCAIYVRVGSRYETKRNNGISHFLEHLLFREKGAVQTVRQIEATGGSVNGMTTFEFTNYFFDTLASEFEQAWDGLYRLVCEPSFGTQEVELERKIILSEVAGMKSSPLAIAYHVAMKEFLPNTSLAMPIPGTRRSLKRISFQQIREFYDAHYVPNNMFVVIVGGVKTESALEAVRRTFAERDSADLPPKQFTLPPRQKRRRELKMKTLVDQGYMAFGIRTDGEKDKHKYEMKLIDVVLGSGRNSRIYKELRVKRGMTDFIASVADMAPAGGAALSDIGCWGVAVGTAPKDLGEAEQIVENEMRRLTTESLPSEELETARSRVLGRFVIACETNSGRAGFYTATELAGEFLSLDENRRRIEAVTPESIAAAAKHKFQDKEVMLLDVKPARGIGKVLAIMRYLFFVRI